jgi:hypothetical protein
MEKFNGDAKKQEEHSAAPEQTEQKVSEAREADSDGQVSAAADRQEGDPEV